MPYGHTYDKVCIVCHGSFVAQKVSTKCCSLKCNNHDYFKRNRAKHNFKEGKRRAQKVKATPKWLTEQHWNDIKVIYDTCPSGYHVDHIIPLQGENVSGLHVAWNLQHLPAKENIAKSNKVDTCL